MQFIAASDHLLAPPVTPVARGIRRGDRNTAEPDMNLAWRNAKARLYHQPRIRDVFHGSQTRRRNQENLLSEWTDGVVARCLGVWLVCCLALCAVSREDSSQSLASCLNLLPSPMEPSGDRIPGKDSSHRWRWTFRSLCWKTAQVAFKLLNVLASTMKIKIKEIKIIKEVDVLLLPLCI